MAGIMVHEPERLPDQSKQSNARTFWEWIIFIAGCAIFLVTLLIGGDGENCKYWMARSSDDLQHPETLLRDNAWLQLLLALQRPLLSIVAAYFLTYSVTGRSPFMARLLGMSVWRPIATLSYSIYLVQPLSASYFAVPLGHAMFGLSDTRPVWLDVMIKLFFNIIIFSLCTLPFALPVYVCIERPGILLGKKMLSTFFRVAGRDGRSDVEMGGQAEKAELDSNTMPQSQNTLCSGQHQLPVLLGTHMVPGRFAASRQDDRSGRSSPKKMTFDAEMGRQGGTDEMGDKDVPS